MVFILDIRYVREKSILLLEDGQRKQFTNRYLVCFQVIAGWSRAKKMFIPAMQQCRISSCICFCLYDERMRGVADMKCSVVL